MDQKNLESKVRELFERQGFEVRKDDNSFTAEKDGETLELKAFSSEEFSEEDVRELADSSTKIFVDEGLSSIKNDIENDISVLREQEKDEDFDLPSYEIIGDIAVINELVGMEKDEAVEGILQHNPQVETILLKQDELKGEYRIGSYDKIYGEETETVHREFGCDYRLDPTKVYFSERFGTERERVIGRIEDGEKVLVMFAGVGPFAILAAKQAEPEKVVAVEKNPVAADYLKQNIKLNNVEDTVEGIEGDAGEIADRMEKKFDRIIMPLPESADEFLDSAFKAADDNAVIHYYRFLENDNWGELEEEIEKIAERKDIGYEIVGKVECGNRSPSETRVCIEIERK